MMTEAIFVLQKVIIRVLYPVGAVLLLGLAAVVLRRRKAAAHAAVLVAFLWLLLCSFPLTGLFLLRTLESEAGVYAAPEALARDGVKHVVVLSGHFREGNLTSSDRLGCSMVRLIEGIRIWKGIPEARLVVTGGRIPGLSTDMSIAEALADAAVRIGVPTDAVIREEESWTTEDQARVVRGIVGDSPFALVTSAYHMPRSLFIFRGMGLRPIPAPCDFMTRTIPLNYHTLIPSADGLMTTQIVANEYLATWGIMAKRKLYP